MANRLNPDEVDPLSEPKPKRDRLTIILSIVHDHQEDQPISVAIRQSNLLTSTEQTWQRRVKIGKEWTPLDLGWFAGKEAGLVILENLTGRAPQRLPSEAEQAEIAAKVVEVLCGEPGDKASTGKPPKGSSEPWLLLPGYPFVGKPSNHGKVYLRCQHGEASVKITVFPQ